MEEYRRLLYVAMTRARDELYVCGYKIHKDSPENSWYGLVEEAMQSQGILRAIEFPDGSSCWRHGPDPTWNGMDSVLPKAAQRFPIGCLKIRTLFSKGGPPAGCTP